MVAWDSPAATVADVVFDIGAAGSAIPVVRTAA
jgi:hypothetical protein